MYPVCNLFLRNYVAVYEKFRLASHGFRAEVPSKVLLVLKIRFPPPPPPTPFAYEAAGARASSCKRGFIYARTCERCALRGETFGEKRQSVGSDFSRLQSGTIPRRVTQRGITFSNYILRLERSLRGPPFPFSPFQPSLRAATVFRFGLPAP